MAKRSKTYRLSEEVINVIEGRDRTQYPTANEYVEKMVLRATDEAASKKGIEEELLMEVRTVQSEIREMRRMLEQIC